MKGFKRIAALTLAAVMTLGTGSAVYAAKAGEVKSIAVTATATTELSGLNYLKSNKSVDSVAYALFIDALVQNDKFGAPAPGIAKSWETSEDGLIWTVKIRDDVKWFTNTGKEYAPLVAQDYVTAAKYILNPANAALTADMILEFIEGAKEYYEAMTEYSNAVADGDTDAVEPDFSTVGVKAVDDTTIEYTMVQSTPFFFSLLTYSSYLPVNEQFLNEVGEDFGIDIDKILYNGAYLFKSWERDKEKVYVKNEGYYQADRIHVPSITYLFVADGHVALEMFKRGEVTQAAIYADQLEMVLSDPELADYAYQTRPQAGSYFDTFKWDTPNEDMNTAIRNINFRKAIFAAENRVVLVSTTVTKNVDMYLINTFVPLGLTATEEGKDYLEFNELPAIRERDPFNKDKAIDYMAKAVKELGNSVTWPITLNYPQGSSEAGVQNSMLFKQMMEETFPGQIVINFKPYTSAQFYDMMDEGDFDFAQSGWSADYADPSNFLNLFLEGQFYDGMYSFHALPEMAEYAELVEAASILVDLDERYEAYAKAEAFLINNAIINPISRAGGNFALNAMNNPYDIPRAEYGMTPDVFLDRIYGEKPLTSAEREAQRDQYNKEVAERAASAK